MPNQALGPAQPEEPGRPKWWNRWLLVVWRGRYAVVSGIVSTWLLLELGTLPFADVARLGKKNPGETAFMREQRESARGQKTPFRVVQRWVRLSEIPPDVIHAVVAAEDGTFWSHEGFDWYELRESLERDLTEGWAARGASTITQQLVKNLYLSPSKNPIRKLKEWILTWWMERTLPKSRILELYLNVIEWGPGIYGAESAAEYHFGKPVMELTREEAARLAAIIPRPRRYRADSEARYVERYARIILRRMDARGW
jgi:monofunctional biosynthetic peptidoglycan transglycosylase